MRNEYRILGGNLKGRDHSENTCTDRIIFKWILGKEGVIVGNGFIWFEIENGGGLL
jgi:hypothetical protein